MPRNFNNGPSTSTIDRQPVSTQEAIDNRTPSPFGEKVVNAASRLNSFLSKRSIDKAQASAIRENESINQAANKQATIDAAHGEALIMNPVESAAANDRRQEALAQSEEAAYTEKAERDQDDAFASYEDNIDATAVREKQEKRDAQIERVKEAMSIAGTAAALAVIGGLKIGKNLFRGAKSASETGYVGTLYGIDAVKSKAKSQYESAKSRSAQRKLNRDHLEAIATNNRIDRFDMESEAEAMNDRFDDETEAQEIDDAYNVYDEAHADNERYDMEAKAEEINEAHDAYDEAHAENVAIDEALAYKENAKRNRAARKAKNRAKIIAAGKSAKNGALWARDKSANGIARTKRYGKVAAFVTKGAVRGAKVASQIAKGGQFDRES